MSPKKVLIVAVLAVLFGSLAWATPTNLTYQGRIIKSDGQPLEYENVSFVFQILNPTGSCVIFQEQVYGYNMVNSKGVFDVPIGKGTVQYPLSAGATALAAFNNNDPFTCGVCSSSSGSYSCSTGSGTYTPLTDDGRVLRVHFYDGQGWRTISPDNVIRSVPFAGYAISAQKLGSYSSSDFLTKIGIPTCNSGEYLSWNGSVMSCVAVSGASGGTVTNVSSANSYLTVTDAGTTPVLTVHVGTTANTVAAGNDSRFTDARTPTGSAGGDLGGSYPSPTVEKIKGQSISATASGPGQVLRFDGGSWTPAALKLSDLAGVAGTVGSAFSVSSCSAHETLNWSSLTDSFTCQAINGLDAAKVTSGTFATARLGTGTADTTKYLRGDGTWQTLNTSDSTKLPLSGGQMSGDIDMNGHKILNVTNVPFVAAAPSSGQNGQTLRWNNVSGEWEWFTAGESGAGVLSVSSANTDIGVSGSANPILTLNSATSGGAGDANKIAKLDGNGRLTSAMLPTMTANKALVSNSSGVITSSAVSDAELGYLSGVSSSLQTQLNSKLSATVASPSAGQVLRHDGSNWVNATLGFADLSGQPTTLSGYGITDALSSTLNDGSIFVGNGSNIATGVTMSGDATLSNTGALTLKNTGTAGTYYKVTTDAQGRVTAGAASLVAADIPSLDWSKITTGKPTTLGGYGITDSVVNGGGVGKITAGLEGAAPAGSATGDLFVATDSQKIYRYNGATWDLISSASGSGGTITGVTAGTGLSGGGASGAVTLNLANTAVSAGSYGSATQVATFSVDAQGRLTSAGHVTITGTVPGGSAGGDLGGTYPNPAVNKIKGQTVSATATTAGQVLRYDGGDWTPAALKLADLAGVAGTVGSAFSVSSCSANETLNWSSLTDSFTCQAINGLDAAKVTTGTLAVARLGTGTADNTKYLRGDGTWQTISTSDATKLPLAGGQMSGDIDMNGNKILNAAKNVPSVGTVPSSGQNGQSLRWNNTSGQWEWFTAGESGAGVLSVSSANADISVSGSTSPILTLNSGTAGGAGDANKIAKLDASGKLASTMLPNIAASNITGVLPIAHGGTNSSATLINNRIMASSGGAIIEAAAITANKALISDGNGIPTASSVSHTELGYLSGVTSSVQTQLDTKLSATVTSPATGQVLRYSGSAWVNAAVNAATDLTGTLAIANGGTGATTAAAARTNLGLGTSATVNTGNAAGNIPLLGTGGLVANKMCTADSTGNGVICTSTIPTGSQWVTAGSDIYYSAGQVGIGLSNPTNKLQVHEGDVQITTTTTGATQNDGFIMGYNGNDFRMVNRQVAGSIQMGTNGNLDQFTLTTAPEGGRIGLGTTTPQVKLDVVGGAVVSRTNIINSGSIVNLTLANNHLLKSVGGDVITLDNIVDGGTYTLVISDTTSRTYTFSGCTNSYFNPANGATEAGARSTYTILTVQDGANLDCYISWMSGFQ
ncbi:MAG: hypothetical protein OM95_14910 [Bdellovibrio sp. ArHS]|uniref:beta strand repeat-containing protein n=1 Tax=Bdellovibrio sp. ArHS TaxID=1569284 RepID=UPI000582A35E|nr:hypothetical protein [Bdellovibrio sp. ArHS]KHD87384.1 MAG: hypothetical protein OM95_14910 [Bdellovibrio sp. ArHS]